MSVSSDLILPNLPPALRSTIEQRMSAYRGPILVKEVPKELDDGVLRGLFEIFGNVKDCYRMKAAHSGRPAPYAFVLFNEPLTALRAQKVLPRIALPYASRHLSVKAGAESQTKLEAFLEALKVGEFGAEMRAVAGYAAPIDATPEQAACFDVEAEQAKREDAIVEEIKAYLEERAQHNPSWPEAAPVLGRDGQPQDKPATATGSDSKDQAVPSAQTESSPEAEKRSRSRRRRSRSRSRSRRRRSRRRSRSRSRRHRSRSRHRTPPRDLPPPPPQAPAESETTA
ncbi:MAG: hypothetical protein MHM6MM_004069 [Cercozoa sp. M6MM]